MPDNHTDERTPEEIEQEIRTTQQDMSRTVDQLQGRMTGRNMLDALLDRAEESGVDARYLLDAARRNPLALALIGTGGLWLVSDADARPSALKPNLGMTGRSIRGQSRENDHDDEGWHREHRTYVAHMNLCERRPEDDDVSYRRRRDLARANYFMIEQGHDEDEHSFRSRLDHATEQLRQRRHQAGEQAHKAGRAARERTRAAASQVEGLYRENPLIGGLAAALVGALAGAALPASRMEEHYLGSSGEKALDRAQAEGRRMTDKARQKKDELVGKADDRLAHAGNQASDNRVTESYRPN